MANINTKLGGTNASDGDVLDAADLNDTFDVVAPSAMLMKHTTTNDYIYTGSGFDATNNETDDHTIQISSTELRNANFIFINITAALFATGGNGTNGSASIKVERNETGASSWSTLYDASIGAHSSSGEGDSTTQIATIIIPVTLTSGEKTNGIDIKITGTTSSPNGTCTVTNKFVWIRGAK